MRVGPAKPPGSACPRSPWCQWACSRGPVWAAGWRPSALVRFGEFRPSVEGALATSSTATNDVDSVIEACQARSEGRAGLELEGDHAAHVDFLTACGRLMADSGV